MSVTPMTLAIAVAVTVLVSFMLPTVEGGSRQAIALATGEGVPCGNTTCTSAGEMCCNDLKCYNPTAGESCCIAAKDSDFPNTEVCTSEQTCCGGDTAMTVTCIHTANETCCTDSYAISQSCGLADSCCPFWGPPTMFNCCGGGKHTTCCSNDEGGVSAASICCPEHTSCCIIDEGETVTCCNSTEKCGTDSCFGHF